MSKNKLLIIDDELGPRESLRFLFKELYDVTCCDGVDKGVAALKENPPDCIITDIKMPGKSGIEGLKEMRAIDPDVSIIMLTGFGALETAQEAIRHGATDYIKKPFDTHEIREIVARHIKRTHMNRKKIEAAEHLEHLTIQLQEQLNAKEHLASLGEESSEFVHDLGNPLSVINNYLDVLRLKLGSDSDADREITILKEEIDRIGQILLRLRHPGTPAGVAQTDINEVVTDLVSIFRQSMCVPRRIDVRLDCDAQMSPVTLDRSALKQVVTNLIKNAVEAMPDGGRLSVSTQRRVLVNSRAYAAVSIEDSGPGISDTIMGKLFEPKPSSKGDLHAGVGLSVVKKLMDAMKAQIVCSSDDAGTRFKLLFPVDIVKQ